MDQAATEIIGLARDQCRPEDLPQHSRVLPLHTAQQELPERATEHLDRLIESRDRRREVGADVDVVIGDDVNIDADLATCSVLVTKLEGRGFVRRDVDPTDRRRTRLYVTEAAEEVMASVAEARREADARIADALGEDAEALRALLARLNARLRDAMPASAGE